MLADADQSRHRFAVPAGDAGTLTADVVQVSRHEAAANG
jgi:hypothetical protein